MAVRPLTESKDAFARATAKQANANANEALAIALHVRKQQAQSRRPMFVGKCSLCGSPCKTNQRYCGAHEWAA